MDGVANPPYGIGAKFVSQIGVEFFNGFDEAHVAFCDEIGKRKIRIGVFGCDLDDEAQIAFYNFVHSVLITFLYTLDKGVKFIVAEQRITVEFIHVLCGRCVVRHVCHGVFLIEGNVRQFMLDNINMRNCL